MGDSQTPISTCVAILADFLEDQISELTVLQEWPYANEQLTMPSVTITTGNAKRMTLQRELIDQTPVDEEGKICATYVVAEWDAIFQLDLWTGTKLDRDIYLAKLLDAFNYQAHTTGSTDPEQADGISLPMTGYCDSQFARFDFDSSQRVDDEAAAQRQERREKITVLVNCREIRKHSYYAVKKIQVANEVTPESKVFSDDASGTDLNTI